MLSSSRRLSSQLRRSLFLRCSSSVPNGPGLEHFITKESLKRKRPLRITPSEQHPFVTKEMENGNGRKVYFEVHGCQMNVSDTEVAWAVLKDQGYQKTEDPSQADVYMVVTCSIREGAEGKIWRKLRHINTCRKRSKYRRTLKIGLLGCMAERLKDQLLGEDRLVDVVAGPDAYRDLPRLLALTEHADDASINVILSAEETYADIAPVRLNDDAVSGFVSIQRGCDNMCSYCIVPFTRGRERSRPVSSILDEVRHLVDQGVKEVTLLGQNVNSYRDISEESISLYGGLPSDEKTRNSPGFKSIYKPKLGGVRFADLLEQVSALDPELRVRFVSPHPKDFPDEVLSLISSRANICKQLHLPAQCGSTRILDAMRRGYTREAYIDLALKVKELIPGVTLTTDMIVGFCGETEDEFLDTLSLTELVKYHKMFIFPYSLREKTHAHRRLEDDVPEDVKLDRLRRLNEVYRRTAGEVNQEFVGTDQVVLIEGDSKRSKSDFQGRNDGNLRVNFPKALGDGQESLVPGDYCLVKITEANSQGLKGTPIEKTTLRGEEEKSSRAVGAS